MFSSLIFRITTFLSLALLIAVVVMQIIEMSAYRMF
jgi:hypothetical protein